MKRVKEVLKSFSRWQYLIDTRNKELATPPLQFLGVTVKQPVLIEPRRE